MIRHLLVLIALLLTVKSFRPYRISSIMSPRGLISFLNVAYLSWIIGTNKARLWALIFGSSPSSTSSSVSSLLSFSCEPQQEPIFISNSWRSYNTHTWNEFLSCLFLRLGGNGDYLTDVCRTGG